MCIRVAFALLLSSDAQISISSLSSLKEEGLFHVKITVPGFVVVAAKLVGASGAANGAAWVAPSLLITSALEVVIS